MGNTGKRHKAVPYSSRPKQVTKNGSIITNQTYHQNKTHTNTVTNNNDQGTTDESFDGDFFDCCGADTNHQNASGVETTALELGVMETMNGNKTSSPTKRAPMRVSSNGDASCDTDAVVKGRAVRRPSSLLRLSRQFSERGLQEIKRRRSSIHESLPDTPCGWAVLTTTLASWLLAYELRLQKSLTGPPHVFFQSSPSNHGNQIMTTQAIYEQMTTPRDTAILSRPIQPSLLVGTRGLVSSMAAYAAWGPHDHDRFREIMTMPADGATLAIDWELPKDVASSLNESSSSSSLPIRPTRTQRRKAVLEGLITQPVVLILHGINNDAGFGYMRSLMRTCTNRGWIAAGMNFRGCGGIPLTTPRGYNGAYTGDIRSVVQQITARFQHGANIPLFLVGNSLGANLMTKYLGEEGLAGTLPPCVKGAISLGNPLTINSGKMKFVPSFALNLGVRKQMLLGWKQFRQMTSLSYQSAYRRALLSNTIGESDHITAPHMIRNETTWPFETKIGYESGDEYWDDASSYRYISHISVPLLQITAQDDFLVYNHSLSKLSHCLSNPNVMVVKTKCGGHLGWHEAPPDTGNVFGFGTSWADTATADFIDSVLKLNTSSDGSQKHPSNKHPPNEHEHDAQKSSNASNGLSTHADLPEVKEKAALLQQAVSDGSHIRSRL